MSGVSHEEQESNQPNQTRNEHDIYTDPAIADARLEDPVLMFFQTWWRHIAMAVVACGIVIYFISAFQETYVASMKGSADSLHRLQEEYRTFLDIKQQLESATSEHQLAKEELVKLGTGKIDQKIKEDAEKKVSDSEKKLNDAKSRSEEVQSSMLQIIGSASAIKEPYKSLAQLYRVLVARAALTGEPSFKIDDGIQAQFLDWEKNTSPNSEERFVKELGALALARGLLDIPEESKKGRDLLEAIAKRGSYGQVSAALAISTISNTAEELKGALLILEDIQRVRPDQSDMLRDEIKRIKAKLN